MTLKEFSRYIKTRNIKPVLTDNDFDSFGLADNPVRQGKAVLIEDKSLKSRIVAIEQEKSGFSYFLDGIERKVVFNDRERFLPLIYGYVAATIMKRTDKKLHTTGLEEKSEKIYLPVKTKNSPENYFEPDEYSSFGFEVHNTGKPDEITGEYPRFPKEFEARAKSDIQETRGKIERELARKWLGLSNNESWLFVDGRLENKNRELISSSRIAGIIKSHHVYYFSPQEQNIIFNLKKHERTSLFQPEAENVFSWYLRLHYTKNSGNLDFGIVRVEIPAKEELIKYADIISNWIILETKPVAFPASRLDRMIYPIKYCEDYLRSKAPTKAAIECM